MAYFLLSITGNKYMFQHNDSKYLELDNVMRDMLYSFGTTKLMDLLKVREFSLLVYSYLCKPNILRLISKRSINTRNYDAYKYYIEEIKRVWEEWEEIRSREY